jgi:hypothetical protein
MTTDTLEAAFRKAFGVFWGQGTIEDFYGFFDERALMADEDSPFVLDKSQFRDHVDFHLKGSWDSIAWIPYEPRFEVVGSTGIVLTNFTLRGRPKGSGFRLRHGVASVVCHYDSGTRSWRAVALLLDPLLGHIVDASPA